MFSRNIIGIKGSTTDSFVAVAVTNILSLIFASFLFFANVFAQVNVEMELNLACFKKTLGIDIQDNNLLEFY